MSWPNLVIYHKFSSLQQTAVLYGCMAMMGFIAIGASSQGCDHVRHPLISPGSGDGGSSIDPLLSHEDLMIFFQ